MWAQIYIFEKEWQFSGWRIRRLTTMCCVVCKFNEEWRDQTIARQLSIIEVKDQGNTPKVSILKDTYHWTKNTHSLRIVKCGSTKRFALTPMQHFHTFWRFFLFHLSSFFDHLTLSKDCSLFKSVFSVFSDPCLLLSVYTKDEVPLETLLVFP